MRPHAGGTLFELNENDLVRFTDCSITVSNPTLRDEVYAFELITDPGRMPPRDRGDREPRPVIGEIIHGEGRRLVELGRAHVCVGYDRE